MPGPLDPGEGLVEKGHSIDTTQEPFPLKLLDVLKRPRSAGERVTVLMGARSLLIIVV